MLALVHQRKLATDPERPEEYRVRLHRRLEDNSGNFVAWGTRQLEPLTRNGIFAYIVLVFTLLGGLKVLLLLSAVGANGVWMLVLHFNRLFRPATLETAAATKGGERT